MRQLPKQDEEPTSIEACFHVAIDIPGFGRSAGHPKAMIEEPAALLSDVVRSLGKSHAYAMIGSELGSSIVVKVSYSPVAAACQVFLILDSPSVSL